MLEALDAAPARIDTPVLFPSAKCGYIDRTSVAQLEDTHARGLVRRNDHPAPRFDAYDARDATVDESGRSLPAHDAKHRATTGRRTAECVRARPRSDRT